MDILLAILFVLILSRFLEEVVERIGQPAILGDLIAGILISIFLGAGILSNETLNFIGNLGIIFLMVLVGLEVNLKHMKKVTWIAVIVAIFSFSIPFILGMVVALSFGFNILEAIITGLVLSIAASAVTMEILEEFKCLRGKKSEILVASGIFDDIIALVALASLVTINSQFTEGLGSIYLTEAFLILKISFFFIFSAFAGYYMIPVAMNYAQKMKSPEAKFAVPIIFILSFGVFAEYFGLHTIIGAFIAGLGLNHYLAGKDKLSFEEDIRSVSEGFMVPLFFVLMAASIDFSTASSNITLILSLFFVAYIGKVAGGFIAGKLGNLSNRDSFTIGLGMAVRGALSLVVIHIAKTIHLSDPILMPNFCAISSSLVIVVIMLNFAVIPCFKRFITDKRV